MYTCFSSCPLLKALKPQRLQWKGTSQVSRWVFKMWKTNGVFSFTSPQATHRYTWTLLERGSCRWKGHKPFWLPMFRALVVVHWLYYFLLLFPVDDSLLFIIGYMLICCNLLWVTWTCWTLCGFALWNTPNYTMNFVALLLLMFMQSTMVYSVCDFSYIVENCQNIYLVNLSGCWLCSVCVM